ncbi:MAG TPA: hypothetical protein VEC99_15665 [Clostridia bacterium]|nr:hypothetical protein [Clostridia bacterium]
MKALEHWVLRVADSDFTWVGLIWLRPAKHQRVSYLWLLLSTILCSLPGVAAGVGVIYLVFGGVEPNVWLYMVVLVTMVELALHGLFGHFWNERAVRLAQNDSRA